MLSEKQKREIEELVESKQEGAYWDFKKEWYDDGKKADLLHDIICMANNLENRDAYIIIGIDEEHDFCVNDISNSANRKVTQMLVDFLRDKKFLGGISPCVMVETLQIENGNVDIIVIKNGYSTPYVLEEKYRDVCANNIYTRVMDCNTPKNKTAEISHIEYLWKKRFHLLDAPLEKIFEYMLRKEDWLDVPEENLKKCQYYKYAPEYMVECCQDDRDGYEYYLFSQMDSRPHWYDIYVKYNQTTLFSTVGIALDGGRYFTNVPCTDVLFEHALYEENICFRYYVKNSKEMILHEFLFNNDSGEAVYARYRFEECILIFYSEEEKEKFKIYAAEKWWKREEYLKNVNLPYMKVTQYYRENAFKEDYENAIVLKKMLDEYRMN